MSELGFGCSAIMGRVGAQQSMRALEKAWDLGINFFDTARSYGYGESEAVLGRFLQGKRDKAVIATKFGILASNQSFLMRIGKPIVRQAVSLFPATKVMIRRQVEAQFTNNLFSVDVLRASIEQSLKKLRTDYVDILYLHSAPSSVLMKEELFGELEKLRSSGKIRMIGFSSEPDIIAEVRRQNTSLISAFQFPCNLFNLGSVINLIGESTDNATLVANHPFGGTQRVTETQELLSSLVTRGDVPSSLREKLTPLDARLIADIVLNAILRGVRVNAVIPAMMKLSHLETNFQAIENSRFSREDITWIVNWIVSLPARRRAS